MRLEDDLRFLLHCSLTLIVAGRADNGPRPDIERLVERHHQYLLALLRYKTGDEEAAKDLLQDTYLSFLNTVLEKGADRFSDDVKVRNYLITIAINKVRDRARSARRRFDESAAFRTNEDMETWLANLAAKEAGPEELLTEREERERLRALACLVMESLSERDRTALALKFARGMDNPGIAEALGIGVKAVESLVFRAKGHFKKEFERLSRESE